MFTQNLKYVLFSVYILYLPPNKGEKERFCEICNHLFSPNIIKVYDALVDNCDILIAVLFKLVIFVEEYNLTHSPIVYDIKSYWGLGGSYSCLA